MSDIINGIIGVFAAAASAVLGILPSDPFQWATNALGQYLGAINYFVPFQGMVDELALLLPAILVWYGLRWVLRFIRFIG
ncbi:hypothetical protein AAC03nite_38720 [Alicyclobacillus acidoterrestris]|nr:hypothetical protein AAC03nite_38720 [Alicyclobacillus acidoterrestris]